VLFLNGFECEACFLDKRVEHVIEPDLESPGGAGFTHHDAAGLVEFAVYLDREVRLGVRVSWYVVESIGNVVVERVFVFGVDLSHETGHRGKGNFWCFHELIDVATVDDGANGVVGFWYSEPWE